MSNRKKRMDTVSSNTGLKEAVNATKPDNNKSKAVVGRLGFIPFQDFEMGASCYSGKWDNNELKTNQMVGLYFSWKLDSSIELISEWAHAQDDNSVKMEGYYTEAHFKFLPEFLKGTFLHSHPIEFS